MPYALFTFHLTSAPGTLPGITKPDVFAELNFEITNLRLPLPRAVLTGCQMLEQWFSNFFFFPRTLGGLLENRTLGPTPEFWILYVEETQEFAFFNKFPLILRLLVQEKHLENPTLELECDFF